MSYRSIQMGSNIKSYGKKKILIQKPKNKGKRLSIPHIKSFLKEENFISELNSDQRSLISQISDQRSNTQCNSEAYRRSSIADQAHRRWDISQSAISEVQSIS